MRARTEAEEGYVRGLRNAESKGFAAGQDTKFAERDCPYKRYEHREFWLVGFRRARKQSQSQERPMNKKLQQFEDSLMDLVAAALGDGLSRDEVVSILEVVTMTTKEADDIVTD